LPIEIDAKQLRLPFFLTIPAIDVPAKFIIIHHPLQAAHLTCGTNLAQLEAKTANGN